MHLERHCQVLVEGVQSVDFSRCNGYYGWDSMGASGDEQSRRGEEGMDIKQNIQVPRVGIGFVINGIMDDRHLIPREGMDDTGTWGVYEIHNDIKQIQVPGDL